MMTKSLLAIFFFTIIAVATAKIPTYKYEVDIKFRGKDDSSVFVDPNLTLLSRDGLFFEVPLNNDGGHAKKSHNVSFIDIPFKIEEIKDVTFGWTTPQELDETSMGMIRLKLKPKYQSLPERIFRGDLNLVSQPQFKQCKLLCEEGKRCPFFSSSDVNHFEIVLKSGHDSVEPVKGKASLLVDTVHGTQINVSLSLKIETLNPKAKKTYFVRMSISNEEIKSLSFNWKSNQKVSLKNVDMTLKPVDEESKPWRKFSVSQVTPNVPMAMSETDSAHKYMAAIKYTPTKSENVFGQPSFLIKTSSGHKINITLSSKRVWMNQTRTYIYELYAATKIEDIKSVSFGWSSPSATSRHVSVEILLKLSFESGHNVRKFVSGDKIKANQHQELSEDVRGQVIYPMTKLSVNVTFQRPFSSVSFGMMSLLLIPDNIDNVVNVTLSKVDENLNHEPFNIYEVEVPLFLEEVKGANFSWTSPQSWPANYTPRLNAYIYIEPVPCYDGYYRTFYLGGTPPNEVAPLWGGKKKNLIKVIE